MKRASAAVELHIDELVLTGFPPRDRFHIRDAVERELARLLSEHHTPALAHKSIALETLDAGRFAVAPDARPQTIGGQIAQALHRHISPPRKGTSARR